MSQRDLLIVGGGIAGMTTAISLSVRGLPVELVEIDPDWRVSGAGITLTGPTFRALATLGLLDEVLARGSAWRAYTKVCDVNGRFLGEVAEDSIDSALPMLGGIMRPDLHEVLATRTVAAGARMRLGVTTRQWRDNGQQVDVEFSDGSHGSYAGVVLADGAFSKNRRALFPEMPEPRYTGQYCWRLVTQRPAEIARGHIYSAGRIFAGLIPTAPDSMYLWLLEPRATKSRIDPQRLHAELAEVMAPFGGILGELRNALNEHSFINVRPLEAILVPPPWHRGRVVLVGDAAHATTPHLASGAGIAIEDGIILSRLTSQGIALEQAYQQFTEARFARCRDVVESSVEIGSLQQRNGSPREVGALIAAAQSRLRADI